jgi:hypothetical protein
MSRSECTIAGGRKNLSMLRCRERVLYVSSSPLPFSISPSVHFRLMFIVFSFFCYFLFHTMFRIRTVHFDFLFIGLEAEDTRVLILIDLILSV